MSHAPQPTSEERALDPTEDPQAEPREQERATARRVHASRGRLRKAYFAAAALWGFIAGSAAVLVALALVGETVRLGGRMLLLLAGAAVAAAIGGVILARAYRDAAQRSFR